MELWIRDMQPVLFPHPHHQYDLKGYGNSQTSEKVGGGLKLLNTKDACAFNHHCTVHTSENHFENKLLLFISICSPCV